MKKNVGGYDRTARFVVGPLLVLLALGWFAGYVTLATGLLGALLVWGFLVVGLVLVVTATTQKCPLNRALGIDTYAGGDTGNSEATNTPKHHHDPEASEVDIEMHIGESDADPPNGRLS